MNLYPSEKEWLEFCGQSGLTTEKHIKLCRLAGCDMSADELGIADPDELYAFEVYRAERRNTELPVGTMWDLPYEL